MKRRCVGLGMTLAAVLLATGVVAGCSSGGEERGVGTLSLPLVSNAASGTSYRLRDASFEIHRGYYYYEDYYNAAAGAGGAPDNGTIVVSSEDDPNASAISVSLDRGSYYVRLLPGWHLEKNESGTFTPVEATLLSSDTQWVYVNPHQSTTAEYQFGIGGRSIWFNGDLNIQIQVYEDPSELYGVAGAPDGVAGAPGGFGGQGWD